MKAQPTIDPSEWDFRGVTEEELEIAIPYELARSNAKARRMLERWLDRKINGQPVRHWLAVDYDLLKLPLEVALAIEESKPPTEATEIVIVVSPFPAPWMSFSESDRRAVAEYYGQFEPWILSINPMDSRIARLAVEGMTRSGLSRGYLLQVDFDKPVAEIASEFEKWLRSEAKNRRKTPIKGGASTPRFHALKQLAAYRLSETGLRYEAAQELVANVARSSRKRDPADVLPRYGSRGAWHKAVEAARAQIDAVA